VGHGLNEGIFETLLQQAVEKVSGTLRANLASEIRHPLLAESVHSVRVKNKRRK
jgi:hypothetical protein